MKDDTYIRYFVVFLVMICFLLGMANLLDRVKAIEKQKNDLKIKVIESDIRKIKQDIFILENGFDYGIEEESEDVEE